MSISPHLHYSFSGLVARNLPMSIEPCHEGSHQTKWFETFPICLRLRAVRRPVNALLDCFFVFFWPSGLFSPFDSYEYTFPMINFPLKWLHLMIMSTHSIIAEIPIYPLFQLFWCFLKAFMEKITPKVALHWKVNWKCQIMKERKSTQLLCYYNILFTIISSNNRNTLSDRLILGHWVREVNLRQ